MKIKKFKENYSKLYSENIEKEYNTFFYEFILRFFDINDITHLELIKDKDSNDLFLICEFIDVSIKKKIFKDIYNYLDSIEEYSSYQINVNDDTLGIEVRFFENKFEKLDPKLKIIHNTIKYNL